MITKCNSHKWKYEVLSNTYPPVFIPVSRFLRFFHKCLFFRKCSECGYDQFLWERKFFRLIEVWEDVPF